MTKMTVSDEEFPFTRLFSERLKEIRDVLHGRKESEVISFEPDEDTLDIDLNNVCDLFESLKKKVLSIDLSEDEYGNIFGEPEEETSDSSPSSEGKRWYDGTYYRCEDCDVLQFGDTAFRSHLKKEHSMTVKQSAELRKYSADFEELTYTCLVCQTSVDHAFKPIYDHLKRSHSLSLAEYEWKYEKKAKNKSKVMNKSSIPEVEKEDGKRISESDDECEVILEKLVTRAPAPVIKTEPVLDSQRKTNYYCPLMEPVLKKTNCGFFTDKKGMKSGLAAKHLASVHKIRRTNEMKPEEYTFKKVKTEIS